MRLEGPLFLAESQSPGSSNDKAKWTVILSVTREVMRNRDSYDVHYTVYTCILVYLYTCLLVYLYTVQLYKYTCRLVYLYTCILVYLYTCIPYNYTTILVDLYTCTCTHTFAYTYSCTWYNHAQTILTVASSP